MTSFRHLTAATVLSLLSASCTPMIDTHGDAIDPDDLASFELGKTPYTEVQKKLGSPSSRTVFDNEHWIYIHSKQSRTAFFKPEEIERTVTILKFNRSGVLEEIETKTMAEGRDIIPAEAVTETNEKPLTIIDQMISNVGRMSTEAPAH